MDQLTAQILRDYNCALDELINCKLIIDANSLIPYKSQKKEVLTWSGGAHLSYLLDEYSTLDHYRSVLQQRDFCFCFYDGGVIQIKYDIEDDGIVGHRLCYFPCPFLFVDIETEAISLSDLPLLFDSEELRSRIRLTSPIRFDFDNEMVNELHAHSHVSINKESCRIPVYGPLSVGHFLRFVLRYFYQSEFMNLIKWDELKPRFYHRTLGYPAPHELHVETEVQ